MLVQSLKMIDLTLYTTFLLALLTLQILTHQKKYHTYFHPDTFKETYSEIENFSRKQYLNLWDIVFRKILGRANSKNFHDIRTWVIE